VKMALVVNLVYIYFIGSAVVKCCQTGKLHLVTTELFTQEDLEPVKITNLKPGADLMMEFNKMIYPVTFIEGLCGQYVHIYRY